MKTFYFSRWLLVAAVVFTVAFRMDPSYGGAPDVVTSEAFVWGQEDYHTFRIPALVTATDGTLIAVVEGRKKNASDPGRSDIDLVYKRSTDHGASWSPLGVLDDPGGEAGACNPTSLVDRKSGRVFVVYSRFVEGRGSRNARAGTRDCQVWMRYSDDHGASWSKGQDITAQARDVDAWGMVFVGPGSGLQMSSGRLIVPGSRKPGSTSDLSTCRGYVIYSDDGGATWQRGGVVDDAPASETQAVELSDGRLLLSMRQGDNSPHRYVAVSDDGGMTWSDARPGEKVTPVCTSIIRFFGGKSTSEKDRILWCGPRGPGRHNLVVRVSYDEARTFVNERLISEGFSAYCNMALLKDRSVGVLWERGDKKEVPGGTVPKSIRFARFGLDFVE